MIRIISVEDVMLGYLTEYNASLDAIIAHKFPLRFCWRGFFVFEERKQCIMAREQI